MKWEEVRLGDILDIKHGYAFKGKYFSSIKTKNILLTPGNFAIGGGYKNTKLKYYNGEIPSDYILKHNDIIVTMTDLSKEADTLGFSAKIPNEPTNVFLHNQRIGLLVFKSDVCNKDYIYWLLRSRNYQKFIAGSASGATVKHTSPSRICAFKWMCPPLKTQKKIAKILSNYDNLIENNLKQIKLLEEKARLTYEEWFLRFRVDGLELEIDSDSGLPFGWEKMKIENFIDTSSGGTPNKKYKEYYDGGNIPWVRTKELKNFMLIQSEEYITKLGLKKSSAKLFPKNTVLLAMYGNTIGEVTFATFETSTNQACCAFIPNEKEKYLSYYIHQYLLNNKMKILSYRMGAAQENISQKIIKKMMIELPDNEALQLFGSKLKLFYNQIENLTLQNQNLKEARDILLPRLMTGIIEP